MMTSSLPIDKKRPLEAWPAFTAACRCLNHWYWGFGKHFWAFYLLAKVKRLCKEKGIPYTEKKNPLKNGELQFTLHCEGDQMPDIDIRTRMENETCSGCIHLASRKFDGWTVKGSLIYCKKYGLNISGTLERSNHCKKVNGKEISE